MSNEKKPGWLGCIGDYTTHLCGDYNIPLFLDPYSPTRIQWKVSGRVFFVAHIVILMILNPWKGQRRLTSDH